MVHSPDESDGPEFPSGFPLDLALSLPTDDAEDRKLLRGPDGCHGQLPDWFPSLPWSSSRPGLSSLLLLPCKYRHHKVVWVWARPCYNSSSPDGKLNRAQYACRIFCTRVYALISEGCGPSTCTSMLGFCSTPLGHLVHLCQQSGSDINASP